MTTYILHGGNYKKESPSNDLFFKQFSLLVPKNEVNFLMCYWARDKKVWDGMYKRDRLKILAQTSKKINTEIATDPVDLYVKLKLSDVLFVSGGEEEFIRPYLTRLGRLKDNLEGKVYIGSSMGAFIVSRNYVLSYEGQKSDNVHQGLGLVPNNILCHWNVETKKDFKIKLLKDKDPQIQILFLDEEKFITLIK